MISMLNSWYLLKTCKINQSPWISFLLFPLGNPHFFFSKTSWYFLFKIAFRWLYGLKETSWLAGLKEASLLAGIKEASWLTGLKETSWLAGLKEASWLTGLKETSWLAWLKEASWLFEHGKSNWLAGLKEASWLVVPRTPSWLNMTSSSSSSSPQYDNLRHAPEHMTLGTYLTTLLSNYSSAVQFMLLHLFTIPVPW